ncbi:hypothetical protein TNCT_338631 [Trichonephila clavata]|uniref:Uncharacterized protein n=1 Tax=Trichonephila clavata TaxID=2740835 RepID=A0A8X6F9C2_TRICU|nr:hypothetical protein TNCT_338631 [Trichonephila clavata]
MSSKAQRRGSDYRRKRKRFHNNQYTRKVSDKLDVDIAYLLQLRNCAKKVILIRNTLSTFKSSPVIAPGKDYEVNTRITYAMRTVGQCFVVKNIFAQQWICHHQCHKRHMKRSRGKLIWPVVK